MGQQKLRLLTAPEGSGSLLCCALSPHDGGTTLAAGGEGAAAMLFDVRSGGDAVTARLTASAGCFERDDAVTSVAFNPGRPELLYCASGCAVTAWDVRMLPTGDRASRGSSVEREAPQRTADGSNRSVSGDADGEGAERRSGSPGHLAPVHRYAFNADEISHVAINKKGAALAAADDGGEVAVVDISGGGASGKLIRTLKGGHGSLASGALFRDHKPWDVVSGGLDCAVVKWDYSRTSPVARWNITELAAAETAAEAETEGATPSGQTQMCNPPFVHAVASAPGSDDPAAASCADVALAARRLVAAACGDGTVALIDVDLPAPGAASSGAGRTNRAGKGKSKSGRAGGGGDDGGGAFGGTRRVLFLGRVPGEGHASAVNHVAFPGWGGGGLLLSGGNDRHVKLWDWRAVAAESSRREGEGGNGVGGGGSGTERCPRDGPDPKGLVLSFKHGRKVNWLCGSFSPEAAAATGGADTFVADTSERISVYALARG